MRSLDAALQEQIATGCPGAILEIHARGLGLDFSEARGLFARGGSQPLRADDAFRAASVTKAVTAAAAVKLAADQQWRLDDPIADYLPAHVTERLGVLQGLRDVGGLTIRRLLDHTSGLPDYFFDEQFQTRVRRKPDRLWRPEELVEAATQGGEMLFAPGTDFAYGDTAYVLVGIAIEKLQDCHLDDAYRSLIFKPLRMESTYLEWHALPRGNDLSHHYDGEQDLRARNLSFDWAGGGLVTTAGDLTRFLEGLFGQVLFDRRWIAELTNWRAETRWRPHSSAHYLRYGMGLGTNIAYGEEIIGATGVWGAFAYYWPTAGATITGTLNLVRADRSALMDAVIRALKQVRAAD